MSPLTTGLAISGSSEFLVRMPSGPQVTVTSLEALFSHNLLLPEPLPSLFCYLVELES